MFNSKKWKEIDDLHNYFNVPSIARISNRLTLERYSNIELEFLFFVDADSNSVILPINTSIPKSYIPKDSLNLYVLRNKKDKITVSNINYHYAIQLISHDFVDEPMEPKKEEINFLDMFTFFLRKQSS